ncbi:MAG: peptidoglycan DD-metalloendopeptidase family protein [Dermatophilaceae bacterium]
MSSPRVRVRRPTVPRGPAWVIVLARVRVPLVVAAALVLALGDVVTDSSWVVRGCAVLAIIGGLSGHSALGRVAVRPCGLRFPVRGRWVAVNSPATKVPSHGVHAHGQTYAVDILHVPHGDWSLNPTWSGPHTRPAEEYPGWGQPVLAPADGTVIRAKNGQRDHRARVSWLGYGLMMLEGMAYEVTGRLLGNHVIIEVGPHTYVVLAHLRRGSVRVVPGDRVQAGEVLGECGNSGNTSEPQVHLQVMDHPRAWLAAGLPMYFTDVTDDDGAPLEIPADYQAGNSPGPPDG